MSPREKLKPCPFCGRLPKIEGKELDTEYPHYSIRCANTAGKCWMWDVSTGDFDSLDRTMKAWNRRVQPGGRGKK